MSVSIDTMSISDTPDGVEEIVYPCKGCGEILEEGKAFELAGNRWHINCFRCNTCQTLLDSDANLLLLGDGSLICNNCTYSCSACGNKIEDLAILTGDQAYCAACFKCRNCKRKIENLRYARTSQGIFCMSCHESLMARRRKKSKPGLDTPGQPRTPTLPSTSTAPSNGSFEKSLPALPPHLMAPTSASDELPSPDALDSDGSIHPSPIPRTSRSNREAIGTDYKRNALSHTDSISPKLKDSLANDLAPQLEPPRTSEDFFIPITLDTTSKPLVTNRSPGPFDKALDSTKLTSTELHKDTLKDSVFGSSGSRSGSAERNPSRSKASPHIAYQDTRSNSSSDKIDTARKRKDTVNPSPTSTTIQQGEFQLQEAPKPTRSIGSKRSVNETPTMALAGQTEGSPVLEQGVPVAPPPLDTNLSTQVPDRKGSFKKSPLSSDTSNVLSANSSLTNGALPSRGDSLKKSPGGAAAITRKEVPRPTAEAISGGAKTQIDRVRSDSSVVSPPANSDATLSAKVISSPLNTAASGDAFAPPPRSSSRPVASSRAVDDSDSFVAPREAPAPPQRPHRATTSVTSIPEDLIISSRTPLSPTLANDASSDYGDDEFKDNDLDSAGLFRKVSKAVRHGRSHSDKIGSSPKWQNKSSRNGSIDISSPMMNTSTADDSAQMRNKLRFSQQRIAELELEKNALQEKVNSTVDIRQVNTELREKRSTMAFLDTQREMVIRELEVMTEHLSKAKETNAPLNVEDLKSDALKDFADRLHKLKDSLTGQIEDLVKKKNDLTNEISNLIQMKDKGFQEYETLSSKNIELTEFNARLVQDIQSLYKSGKQASNGSLNTHPTSNALGIYTSQPKDRSDIAIESRQAMSFDTMGTHYSGDTDNDSTTMLTAPQVVNIRKGQPKKFNWKKGSEKISTNVKKGFKGAFSSTAQPTNLREESFAEGVPYGSVMAGEAPIIGDKPMTSRTTSDPRLAPWQMLPKQGAGGKIKDHAGALPAEDHLYGSDLTARCEFEGRMIPAIVTRCIQEVDERGMNIEGIYRKSGGQNQVKAIQAGFEKDSLRFDISDPDLDINAIASTLKQYMRSLPMPLITFDCYNGLLEAIQIPVGPGRVEAVKQCVAGMPRAHRDTLEFLIFHLVRVVEDEKENLMSQLNVSVVFAPTIMRPEDPSREMADIDLQRHALIALLHNSIAVFGGDSD